MFIYVIIFSFPFEFHHSVSYSLCCIGFSLVCCIFEWCNSKVIRERISTATLILVAIAAGERLRRLHVRRNALLLRADWPKPADWSTDYYSSFKQISLSYELTQREVSRLLHKDWQPLTDSQFKAIKINVQVDC